MSRLAHLQQAPNTRAHAAIRLLARICGIGIETADMLTNEVLLRNMRDRRGSGRRGWPLRASLSGL
jgi:transposase